MITQEGQYELNGLTMGDGTPYMVTMFDMFAWPMNRGVRTPLANQHGARFDRVDLFDMRTVSVELIVKETAEQSLEDLVEELNRAALTHDPDELINLDVWWPGDTVIKRIPGRTRAVAWPSRATQLSGGAATASFSFESPYAAVLSRERHTASGVLPTTASGFSYPLTFNRAYGGGGEGGHLAIMNEGSFPYEPLLRFTGPVARPFVYHQEQDKLLSFDIELAVGSYLDVNAREATVMLNGTASRYSTMSGKWFTIQPGINTLRFGAGVYSQASQLQVFWHDAWI